MNLIEDKSGEYGQVVYDCYFAKYKRLAKEDFIKKLYMENIRLKSLSDPIFREQNPEIAALVDENSKLRQSLDEKNDDKKVPAYFFTIRPPETVSWDEFYKTTQAAMKKKWLTQYIYAYEQVGTSSDMVGHGKHFHALIFLNGKKLSHMKREFKSTFKYIIDFDHDNLDNFYNFKPCVEKDIKNRINYIVGDKHSTAATQKDVKQQYDIIFRQQKGIKPYYKLNINIYDYLDIPIDQTA